MFTKISPLIFLWALLNPIIVSAESSSTHHHGFDSFHAFTLEADAGLSHGSNVEQWDFDGWYGSDNHKLWMKSEGERKDDKTEKLELWALYSKNIATFWDAQIGIRHDTKPLNTSYFAVGLAGLARYNFETDLHLFLSDEGDGSVRFLQEYELLLTQKAILKPFTEIDFYFQDVPEQYIGKSFSSGSIGMQFKYEFTRKFGPYMQIEYERLFEKTKQFSVAEGERGEFVTFSIGLFIAF